MEYAFVDYQPICKWSSSLGQQDSISTTDDNPAGTSPVRISRADIWAWIAGAAILLVFAVQLWGYFGRAYGAGVDEATYFMTGKSLAMRHAAGIRSDDPLVFMRENMNEVQPGLFYQKYPIGFPLLIAAGYKLGGQFGVFIVNPVIACLALLGVMVLTRELAGNWAAILAGLVLALHPLMVCYATGALSHISDLCFTVWGLWCREVRSETISRLSKALSLTYAAFTLCNQAGPA